MDLLLIHAPMAWEEIVEKTEKTYYEENLVVWGVMEKLYKEGKCRSIGVSNFEIHDIQNLLDHAEIKPQVNQIKVHIGYYPKDLVDYCQANDILVEAYSPNATGKLRENPVVVAMAEKYGVSIPQLGIRFDLQLDTLPLPKTTHEEYMVENAAVDFEISKEDMECVLEILDDISSKIEQKKKPGIIKTALIGLKDFVLAAGANITAALITAKIQGLF